MSTENFPALPEPRNADGEMRRVGVELEFAELSASDAAEAVARAIGAECSADNPHAYRLDHPELGAFEIYLDMAGSHPSQGASESEVAARKALGDVMQTVVPVELVCPPVAPDQLSQIQQICDRLEAAGARGTREALLYAFGTHLNVEIVRLEASSIAPVLRTYVLIEDWLREVLGINLTRRMLNFVDPFPSRYVDRLAAGEPQDMDALIEGYLADNPTRNRSLDMTPVLALADRDRVEATLGDEKLKPRPTYHYRLPDCGLGQSGWSLAQQWAVWVHIEKIAGRRDVVDRLARIWLSRRAEWLSARAEWAAIAARVLNEAGLGAADLRRERKAA